MSRELIGQLEKIKREINAETHELETKYSDLQQQFPWLVNEELTNDDPPLNDKELAVQAEFLKLNIAKLSLKARLHRAHFFGPRYTRSLFPTLCIKCFVVHYKESQMVKVPVGNDCWDGLLQFECPECKHVLRVHPE